MKVWSHIKRNYLKHYNDAVASPTYARNNYERRLTGVLLILFGIICLAIASYVHRAFNIPDAIAVGAGTGTALFLSIIIAQYKTNKKFGGKQ